jgi:release factor glutamine methyltransferase
VSVKLLTIKDIRSYFKRELGHLYDENETGALAKIIIKTITGVSGLHQLNDPLREFDTAKAPEIIRLCMELKTGKPYQYVIGETVFYDCTIKVNPSVLIPRPETEELADHVIKENRGYKGGIIDFGTGSGCIAIALAANLPEAEVSGVDISDGAIELARENAKLNNVTVNFFQGDIFDLNYRQLKKPGMIVSNPPYVRHSEKKLMKSNVLDFEPHSALFVSDSDPLAYYRALLTAADGLMPDEGKIYFEINEAMGEQMLDLVTSYGYSDVSVINDINGKNRIIKGIRHGR